MDLSKFIKCKAGGISHQRNGGYDCEKQACVIGIAFQNGGNQRVRVTFGGAERLLAAGQSFTHFTNYPYLNTTEYRWQFIDTPVAVAPVKLINIFTLKISDV